MNLLSIGAAYGVLVMVFQWGWGRGLLGLEQAVPIAAFVPLIMFAILFGLSMDYEVFLLSRIREEFLRTGDNRESVATGRRVDGPGDLVGGADHDLGVPVVRRERPAGGEDARSRPRRRRRGRRHDRAARARARHDGAPRQRELVVPEVARPHRPAPRRRRARGAGPRPDPGPADGPGPRTRTRLPVSRAVAGGADGGRPPDPTIRPLLVGDPAPDPRRCQVRFTQPLRSGKERETGAWEPADCAAPIGTAPDREHEGSHG